MYIITIIRETKRYNKVKKIRERGLLLVVFSLNRERERERERERKREIMM